MGYVVYSVETGRLIQYYKKIGPAKAAVTRHKKDQEIYRWAHNDDRAWCSYRDYEGVLLGLRGAELKMWQFCNTKNG
jgi:hypothetical protein